jgi:hypothetical protein
MNGMKVRLIDADTNLPLRKCRDDNYFDIKSVPQIGSKLIYYPFNEDNLFKGNSIEYAVLDVVQELQEWWNGSYQERYTVLLKKI